MSAPSRGESRAGEQHDAVKYRFSRWPGQLVLMMSWLFPPVLVLWNQEMSYMTIPWACARGAYPAIHVVPVICLAAVGLLGWLAVLDWRRAGGGRDEDSATIIARSRFLALLGMFSAAYAALIILAMWLPMFFFDACVTT
jgi:hypothetical protein